MKYTDHCIGPWSWLYFSPSKIRHRHNGWSLFNCIGWIIKSRRNSQGLFVSWCWANSGSQRPGQANHCTTSSVCWRYLIYPQVVHRVIRAAQAAGVDRAPGLKNLSDKEVNLISLNHGCRWWIHQPAGNLHPTEDVDPLNFFTPSAHLW